MTNEPATTEAGTTMPRRSVDRLLSHVPVDEAVARTGLPAAEVRGLADDEGRVALQQLRASAVAAAPVAPAGVEVLGRATL